MLWALAIMCIPSRKNFYNLSRKKFISYFLKDSKYLVVIHNEILQCYFYVCIQASIKVLCNVCIQASMKILCSHFWETFIWKGEGKYSSYLKKKFCTTNSSDSCFIKYGIKHTSSRGGL